jgi:hypothetical protein
MGEVEQAVRRAVRPGQELRTPGLGKPLEVADLTPDVIVLLLGKGRHWTLIPWEALEGIPDLLRARRWIRTARPLAPSPDVRNLSGHLKQFVRLPRHRQLGGRRTRSSRGPQRRSSATGPGSSQSVARARMSVP